MSDDKITNLQTPNLKTGDHGGYEREDLSARGVFYFMAGLALLVLVLYFVMFGMYRFLDSYEQAHQPPISPMVTPRADTRTVTPEDTQAFPQPRLEKDEGAEFQKSIENQDRHLATYNWVDKDKGVVQIPIDRAMDLILQRGLPVRSENARTDGSTGAQTTAPGKIRKQAPKAKAAKAGGN